MFAGAIEIVGITIGTIGKLLIAWTAISVHRRILLEHKIDEFVFKEMQHERRIAILGVVCLVVGWGFEILPIVWVLNGIG